MPEFKSKEEYEKWKAEKIKSNEEKIQKIKEEERLRSFWVCPECLSSNNNSQLKCSCGYTAEKTLFQDYRGNLTSSELYKTILNEFDVFNDNKAIFLSHYLIRRFPETEEARKIKERMDSHSIEVVCGKCGSKNIYNPKYYQKEKCDKCGDWLHQYIKSNVEKSEVHKESRGKGEKFEAPKWKSIMINCPSCRNKISINAQSCPKCGEPIIDTIRQEEVKRIGRRQIIIAAVIVFIILLGLLGKMLPEKSTKVYETSPTSSPTLEDKSYSPTYNYSDSPSETERTRKELEKDEIRRKRDALQPLIGEACRQGNDEACRQYKDWESLRKY